MITHYVVQSSLYSKHRLVVKSGAFCYIITIMLNYDTENMTE